MNYNSNSTFLTPIKTISGYQIALGKHNAVELAFIAGELFLERRRLVKPRIAQLVRMCQVSSIYVNAAIMVMKSGDADLESRVRRKRMPLLEGAAFAKHRRIEKSVVGPHERLFEVIDELGLDRTLNLIECVELTS